MYGVFFLLSAKVYLIFLLAGHQDDSYNRDYKNAGQGSDPYGVASVGGVGLLQIPPAPHSVDF